MHATLEMSYPHSRWELESLLLVAGMMLKWWTNISKTDHSASYLHTIFGGSCPHTWRNFVSHAQEHSGVTSACGDEK